MTIRTNRWPALIVAACLVPVAWAGKKEGDESWEIQQRIDWFYGQRGLDIHAPNADLTAARLHRAEEARKLALLVQEQERNRTLASLWSSVGPAPMTMFNWAFGNVSGRVTSVAIDPTNPNIHYVTGGTGGLWKTTNGGASYTSIFDQIGTQAMGGVAISPTSNSTLWVGTGDFICDGYYGMGAYLSTDAGGTWQQRNGSGGNQMLLAGVSSVILHPTNPSIVIMGGPNSCGGSGGIYYTSDAGLNWTRALTSSTYEVVRDPTNPSILYAAVSSATPVQKSTDGGATWNPSSTGLPTSAGRCEVAVAPSNPAILYFLHAGTSTFYQSTNSGVSWTSKSTSACDGQCTYNMTIEVNATDPNTVYRGTIRLFRTTDAGSTWTALTTGWGAGQKVHQDTHVVRRHPTDPNSFYVGSDGGLWKTTDGGSTFQNLNANLNMTMFYDVAIDPTTNTIMLGGSQDNSSEAYSGSPLWDVVAVTGDGFVNAINPNLTSTCYIASYPSGGPNVARSTTGPQGNYSYITNSITDNASWVTPYILDPANPDTMYLGTTRVWKSTDRGTTWNVISPTLAGGTMTTVEVARSAPTTIYAAGSGGNVNRTTDGGANWVNVKGNLPSNPVSCVRVDPSDSNHVYVALGTLANPVLWYSTTGGNTWTSVTNGLPSGIPADSILLLQNPSRIYVGTDLAVYVSTSGDAGPYVPDMNGMPLGVVVSDLEYNAATNTITAGTYGRGAWQKDATQVDTWNITVGKGAGSPAVNDSRVNAYRSDGSQIAQLDFVPFTAASWGANHAGGDVTGDGVDEVMTGQGPGPTHPPNGKGFTSTGAAIAGIDFAAYGGSGYGLNVAAGDVDGDGIREIVTGPGEGVVYGPQVRAFNYDNTAITSINKINYYAYGTLRYGVNVASIGFDTDLLYSEIVTGAGPGDVFGPHVRGWNYDGSTLTAVSKVSFFAFSTLKFGVNVSGGDVEGDTYDELLPGAGPGAVFGSAVRGFNYDGATITAIAKINFIAFGTSRYGANVASADIEGDGFAEIAVGPGPDPATAGLLKAFDYDGTTLVEISALNKTVWPGLLYGTTVGTGNYGY
ncbi:MAG: hypothetical protein U0166_25235 [Acidobacteriota bacterium]